MPEISTSAGLPPSPDRPRLLSLENGEKAPPTFSHEEMERRLARLRGWMREAAVDACLFTSIHNVNYFADYVYCSFGRHYGLVVDHDAHTLVSANLDYGRPSRREPRRHPRLHRLACGQLLRRGALALPGPGPDRRRDRPPHLRRARQARGGPSRRPLRRCERRDDAHPDDQVPRGAGVDPRRRGHRRPRRRGLRRSDRGERPGARGRPACDARDVAGDRAPLPGLRAHGHVDVVPVRPQHRRRPQPGDDAPGGARRRPQPQLLPDDLGLLPRSGADPVLRPRAGRGAPPLGGQLRGAPPGTGARPAPARAAWTSPTP